MYLSQYNHNKYTRAHRSLSSDAARTSVLINMSTRPRNFKSPHEVRAPLGSMIEHIAMLIASKFGYKLQTYYIDTCISPECPQLHIFTSESSICSLKANSLRRWLEVHSSLELVSSFLLNRYHRHGRRSSHRPTRLVYTLACRGVRKCGRAAM